MDPSLPQNVVNVVDSELNNTPTIRPERHWSTPLTCAPTSLGLCVKPEVV